MVTHLSPATTRAPHPALAHLLHHPKLNASRLALHLLHLDPATPEAPNVFLNLARLFAPTRTLLLVPGTPKPPPLSSILSLSIAHIRDPVILQMAAPRHGTGIAPSKGRLATPAVLSPMLILRDHPLWCTERFAFAPAPSAPRTVDWDECLWQAQLETFGAATAGGPVLQGWRWDVEPEPAELTLRSISLVVSIPSLCVLDSRRVLTETVRYSPQARYTVSCRDVCACDQAARDLGRGLAQRRPRTCRGALRAEGCGEDALVT